MITPHQKLELWLIRHGTTDWNGLGLWQGLSDRPLSEEGIAQAKQLGKHLQNEQFDGLYASDLQRAAHTAELIRPNEALTLDNRLREMHFGEYEGMKTADIRAHAAFADWQVDPWRLAPPNGTESLLEVAERMVDWANELPAGRILAVSHSVTIRALLTLLFDWSTAPQPDYAMPFKIKMGNTSVTKLQRHEGVWTLEALNLMEHLEVKEV